MITYALEQDGHMIRVHGRTICIITNKTPQVAVDKFVELCKANEPALIAVTLAAETCRHWNMNNPDESKDWHAFHNLEHLRAKLLREAGIKDT